MTPNVAAAVCDHLWTQWGCVGPENENRRDCVTCGAREVVVEVADAGTRAEQLGALLTGEGSDSARSHREWA